MDNMNQNHQTCNSKSGSKTMAKDAQKIGDYNWRVAYGDKLQDDVRRLQEENEYLKKLLWNSPNSWIEKQRAAALVKEEATEIAVERQVAEECGPPI